MEDLISLHRYWVCANRMKLSFYDALTTSGIESMPEEMKPISHIFIHPGDVGVFMGAWYSYLYVTIEGYRELELCDEEINKLLESDHVDRLRKFRNATFHYQKEWLSEKTMGIFEKDLEDDHVEWVRDLHIKLGDFLLNSVKESFNPETRGRIQSAVDMMVTQQSAPADAKERRR